MVKKIVIKSTKREFFSTVPMILCLPSKGYEVNVIHIEIMITSKMKCIGKYSF